VSTAGVPRVLGAEGGGELGLFDVDADHLVRIVKRKLKKIAYRPHLTGGCLAGTGLTIGPW